MHVLSELRNPLFTPPDRQRALRALQLSRLLKENNHTKPWEAVKSMIDKVVGENIVERDGLPISAPFTPTPGAAPRPVASTPGTNGPNVDVGSGGRAVYPAPAPAPEPMSGYEPQRGGILQSQSQISPHQPLQAMASMQQQDVDPFNWDSLNFSNIVGDTLPPPELPEFDFGFWGDPVNFGSEPLTFPLDGGYGIPWAG
jgi:hypothetical protein